jgi:hypothetical protein
MAIKILQQEVIAPIYPSFNMVTIDPGFNTAIADWSTLQDVAPPDVSFFTVPDTITVMEDKLAWAWVRFEEIMYRIMPAIAYIEDTALWQENLTSLVSGSSGDLFTLTKLIGGYCHVCMNLRIKFKLITVESWKGQTSKDVVERRIIREKGWMFKNDHITDAVGIGLSMINKWRVTK